MKTNGFIKSIILAIMLAGVLYWVKCASTPFLYEDRVWYYVDQQTGVNYLVVDNKAVTPRLKQSGELYITR